MFLGPILIGIDKCRRAFVEIHQYKNNIWELAMNILWKILTGIGGAFIAFVTVFF